MKSPRFLKVLSSFVPAGREVTPLADREFARLMEPFGVGESPLALAVSGGPDSMALAHCLGRWVKAHKKPVVIPVQTGIQRPASVGHMSYTSHGHATLDSRFRGNDIMVICFIVDHGLREESADEAQAVKERLEAMGLRAEILRWEHGPVATRVHVQARKARFDLLVEACKRHGARDLLLAHQLDDQAETILMRFAKGSGIDGLAGMARVTEMDGVRLLRPLLGVPKERLVATCHAAGIDYVTDPSNAKAKYARGRLRRVQELLAEEGFTPERLADLGERAAEAKDALDHYTRALLRVAVAQDAAGMLKINLEQLRSAPQAVALRALAACLQTVHPSDYAPERAMLLPVLNDLLSDMPMGARTLHGCVINKTDRQATIVREYGAITDEQPIAPGQTVEWDRRWRVRLAADCKLTGLTVRALGIQTHDVLDKLAPGLRQRIPQGRLRASLPALWEGRELKAVPDVFDLKANMACAELINSL